MKGLSNSISVGLATKIKSSFKSFLKTWINDPIYYCWDEEEMFILMTNFLNKHNYSILHNILQDAVSHHRQPIASPDFSYTQLLDIFNFSPLDVCNALNDISYTYMEKVSLFQFLNNKNKCDFHVSWSIHYNRVTKNLFFQFFFSPIYFLIVLLFFT